MANMICAMVFGFSSDLGICDAMAIRGLHGEAAQLETARHLFATGGYTRPRSGTLHNVESLSDVFDAENILEESYSTVGDIIIDFTAKKWFLIQSNGFIEL